DHPYSPDFQQGFLCGFADYLYAGGTGNPPPLPPRGYWKSEYETPEGRQAVQDWFEGFRTGAARARASGYRELVTVPISALPPPPPLPPPPLLPPNPIPPAPVESHPSGEKPPAEGAMPAEEVLPGPRSVPIEPGAPGEP